MRKRLLTTASLLAVGLAQDAAAADEYLGGNISNISSHGAGLMVMLDTGVPTNCSGVGYNWMTIPEANKTMIAVALLAWQLGRGVTVYTNPLSNGFCTINQLDPAEN